jgi:hypothetical protein
MSYYTVTIYPDSVITIQATNIDEAWDKAKKLGEVLNVTEI